MRPMIGLVEKDTKVVIMTVFHLFKKPDERLRHGNYIYIYIRERESPYQILKSNFRRYK